MCATGKFRKFHKFCIDYIYISAILSLQYSRDNIVVGTWNVRTLTADGKLEELAHEMNQYCWNILGISELCWKGFGKTLTDVGHKVYSSGKDDKHKHSLGSLVNKDIMDTVMGCWPVTSRLITILLTATPFNINIIPAYAPISTYEDSNRRFLQPTKNNQR